MKDCSKFVCVESGSINFLIPSSQIVTSLYCKNSSNIKDDKFCFENNLIPFFSFFDNNFQDDEKKKNESRETALIVKSKELLEKQQFFAIITSKECSVLDVEYRNFSLFSPKIEKNLRKKGFIACYFKENKIFYLVDIEVFIKNFKV